MKDSIKKKIADLIHYIYDSEYSHALNSIDICPDNIPDNPSELLQLLKDNGLENHILCTVLELDILIS